MKIILRPFNLLTDAGIIYSTFPKGVYFASHEPITTDKSEWFKAFYRTTKALIETADITIACLESDPDTIVGYAIKDNAEILHYIYVKVDYRNQGIAKLLFKNHPIDKINPKTMTKVGYAIITKGQNNEQSASETD